MASGYFIGIDQSTQATKALLFNDMGHLLKRTDIRHRQHVDARGWVSHDPEEIYRNVVQSVRNLIEESTVNPNELLGVGISNQRETSLAWDRKTGHPLGMAVVWQCARAAEICERIADKAEAIREKTGIHLSPYFPAVKIAWLLEHEASGAACDSLCYGTIDSWLIFKLTQGRSYKTDYSNASRTQLFNIFTLSWDEDICRWLKIAPENLAEVCDSDADFGETDFDGFLKRPIPIHGVLGDSHGALFAQGCLERGMTKTTYGTGSSIMMNIGNRPLLSNHGVVTSLAWRMSGRTKYVLEGNLNYTGAVVAWLKDGLKLIESAHETQELAEKSHKNDALFLIPAFSGLGAPYWDSKARAAILGMDRTTGRSELCRAALESIAYQIADVVKAMEEDLGSEVQELRVDGGPTKNKYLMQFQSDILQMRVQVPETEEFSGMGPVYAAGLAMGIWDGRIFDSVKRSAYDPGMDEEQAKRKYSAWKMAVSKVLSKT